MGNSRTLRGPPRIQVPLLCPVPAGTWLSAGPIARPLVPPASRRGPASAGGWVSMAGQEPGRCGWEGPALPRRAAWDPFRATQVPRSGVQRPPCNVMCQSQSPFHQELGAERGQAGCRPRPGSRVESSHPAYELWLHALRAGDSGIPAPPRLFSHLQAGDSVSPGRSRRCSLPGAQRDVQLWGPRAPCACLSSALSEGQQLSPVPASNPRPSHAWPLRTPPAGGCAW